MSDIAIRVEDLGKLYHIGAQQARYKTLRDSLVGAITGPIRRLRNPKSGIRNQDTIWALKDVSFEVKQGEVVGIIGRNGAGKSTLLKILSHITEPTEGRVRLYGRVGSLLEVGTGFHPELTGRENIYLNGAILGMRKTEIERKFDEIVAFSEIEKFLDTPVKRYSSGMYVRLAFAVAAHLDPEILVVDEVLAVGDAEFQRKCLGKINDVAKGGRTVCFVSHNMGAIEALCSRTFLLDMGAIILAGDTPEVVSAYLAKSHLQTENPLANCVRTGSGKLRVRSIRLETPEGQIVNVARSGGPLAFAFEIENRGCKAEDIVSFGFSVHTDREVGLFHYYSHFSDMVFDHLPLSGYIKCLIPELSLAPGNYLLACRVVINGDQRSGEEVDYPHVFVPFAVSAGDFYRTGDSRLSTWGPILVKGNWYLSEERLS